MSMEGKDREMAKKMGTGAKVLLGTAAAAAVGGVGYFAYKRWRTAKDERLEDEYAETHTEDESLEGPTLSAEKKQALSQALQTKSVFTIPLARVGGAKPPVFRSVDTGSFPVTITVEKPHARLRFDEDHYREHSAAKLMSNFKDKEVVSFKKSVSILWGDCTGKGPPTDMLHSGTHVPLSHPRPVGAIYYAKLTGTGATPKAMGDLLAAFNPDRSKDRTDDVLNGSNFRKVTIENAPLTGASENNYLTRSEKVQVYLAPGRYLFCTPLNLSGAGGSDGKPWKYWKGYWQWTSSGPHTKSCESQRARFFSGNHCSNHITVFGRWSYVQSLEHIIRVVDVTSSGAITLRPMFTINIGNLHYYRTDAAERFGRICRIANAIVNLAERVSGWDIRSLLNSFADLCGC